MARLRLFLRLPTDSLLCLCELSALGTWLLPAPQTSALRIWDKSSGQITQRLKAFTEEVPEDPLSHRRPTRKS